ncbi:MAG: hypothetical protein LUD74_06630, partial [Tannerellaceae bacterium]|nr:hypothetical protein [Tannerellaceae bacterium]
MKKTYYLLLSFFFLLLPACSADDVYTEWEHNGAYLADKPMKQVKHFIKGRWKLIYSVNGFAGITTEYPDTYWEISKTHLKITDQDGNVTSKRINWVEKYYSYDKTVTVNIFNTDGIKDKDILSPFDYVISRYE